jgi:predicted metal-binding membrane protein
MKTGTPLEKLLLRDRWMIGVTLLALTALCWAWIGPMAVDMYGSMTGSSAWMMTRRWDVTHQLLLFLMWTVMMVGMMLPSATPALFLYLSVIRKSPDSDRAPLCAYLFAAGYLWVWTLFSLFATALQLLLNRWLLLSPMMEPRAHWFGGSLLLLGGIYQWTSFKKTCLESCRSPVLFITRHWKPGLLGGFQMGMAQGWYCLGCCWALMLLLFAGGVMNLWWIGALTIFVLLEKLAPLGVQGGRLSGAMIILFGVWTLLRGTPPQPSPH